ncbi:hypothetical protein Tco_0512594 [Tanacetum coccineum]
MSTAEAEYVSLSACCAQVIWMRTQLLDYGYRYNKIPIYSYSKSAIAISCNLLQHSCTKHINIRYHFIKEHVKKGITKLYFVGTEYQLAHLFTKSLPKERFEYLVHKIAECKIFGILLVDHALSHALIATTDVPVMETLQLPVENPFIVPTDLKYILRFLKIVGYEGIVDKEYKAYEKKFVKVAVPMI